MTQPGIRHNPMYALSMRILDAIGAVRPEERRETLGAFLTLFGFMAGHALLETARDALFLASLPVSLLPWVYLTIAAIAFLLTRRQPRLLSRLSSLNELSTWLIFSGLVTLGFWIIVNWGGGWVFYALYAWSGVLATLVVVQFWTVLSDRFTVTQAKRLFAVVGSGSVLGAIVGSGLARILTAVLPAHHVVLSAALVFLVSSFAPTLLGSEADRTAGSRAGVSGVELRRVGRLIWTRPYLRRVAIVVLLSTVTFTLVDFVFKSTVARSVPDESLGEFFASVYFTLNLLSLAVQILGVGWLIRRVGVNTALAIVPALLLAGAVGFVGFAGLTTVLLLKGADGSLRYSLYRTATELLFVPMSVEIRGRVKAFIDVLGQRGGQALASLLILLTLTVTTKEVAFAAAAVVTAAVWLFLVLDLKQYYLDVFRETLSEEITETRIEFPALDVASLETLLSTLSSPDDRRVVAAFDLLAAQKKLRVVPALILYHPSPAVVIHALDLFAKAKRDDVLPIVDRLLAHPDAGVRTASLRVRSAMQADEAILRRALHDEAPDVRATAFVGLVAAGWAAPQEAQEVLAPTVQGGSREARIALAQAVRDLAPPGFEGVLLSLAASTDPAVQVEAVRAMREVKNPGYIPTLIRLLDQRAVRDEVRTTLVGLGSATLARLASALRDPTLPHGVRRHLPNAIGAFGSPQAAAILLKQLLDETDGMVRFKILRALGRLRAENRGLPLDGVMLERAIDQNLAAAFRFRRWRRAVEGGAQHTQDRRTPGHEVLVALLKDKQNHTLERLFRLLNLQANDDDFLRIYRGLNSGKREARAGSRELVENLVMPPVRRPLLTLLDDLYDTAGLHADQDAEDVPPYEAVLRELLESGTESLSCVAAYHIGELRVTELREALERQRSLSAFHADVLRQAREMLDEPRRREVRGGG